MALTEQGKIEYSCLVYVNFVFEIVCKEFIIIIILILSYESEYQFSIRSKAWDI